MAKDIPVTEILAQVKAGNPDATAAIANHFWEAARNIALRSLDPRVGRAVSGSDIANAALRSVLSNVSKPESHIDDRAAFFYLLRKAVKRKAASAGRRETADKRDVRRRVPLPMDRTTGRPRQRPSGEDQLVQQREQSAVARVEADELAEDVGALLKRESDEIKQRVKVLGIMRWLDANEVLSVLAIEFPDKRLPSRSTIHVMIRETREKLPAALANYRNQKRRAETPATRTLQENTHEAKKKVSGAVPKEYGELVRLRAQRKNVPKKRGTNASQEISEKSGKKGSQKGGKKRPTQGRKKSRKSGD